MAYSYDPDNIFAKILKGEIPKKTVLETEHTLAFRDIYPQAPVHVLVIPKGPYVNFDHFAREATDAEIVDFTRAIGEICRKEGLEAEGFRLIANAGVTGVQDVPHLHVHILAGLPLGRMLSKP
ncbi:histidine triad nucleotide-binding protein [Maliponia aquimaris]|uniref:HIT-like protein n=1 Tax=Maliponia aquimaris TaxID=1673631 RepID=A0A238JSJ5_9RHOB|nr:histidine triad nucleotide-binding protein [Maliponia aquimaris]SMX33620.1 HIT-like protein [Maliponia aquimaris]